MKNLNKYLFSLILALLLLPGIQTIFSFVKEKPLNGVHIEQVFPIFTFQDWFSLDYQPKLNKYFVQNFGFRPFFTRLYNQIDFSVFKKANGYGVIVGKNDYLFESWFIKEYYGRINYDERIISNKVNRLSWIKENLEQFNTSLLMIIAPGKSYIYPEYIPSWMKSEKKASYYEGYAQEFENSNIPFIDLNKLFIEMKDTVKYPLFPKTGTHWSFYGVGLIMDSIVKKVEQIQDIKMNHLNVSNYKLVSPNDDLEKIMNLFTTIAKDSIAYPIITINEEPNTNKPNVIIIGDSFYWWLAELNFANVFGDFQFWYYYKSVFNKVNTKCEKVEEIDILSRVALADIVIILQSTASLGDLGWGFIDELSNSVENNYDSYETMKIRQTIENIKSNPDWLNMIKEKAIKRNIPLDSMLYLDAKYLSDKE